MPFILTPFEDGLLDSSNDFFWRLFLLLVRPSSLSLLLSLKKPMWVGLGRSALVGGGEGDTEKDPADIVGAEAGGAEAEGAGAGAGGDTEGFSAFALVRKERMVSLTDKEPAFGLLLVLLLLSFLVVRDRCLLFFVDNRRAFCSR